LGKKRSADEAFRDEARDGKKDVDGGGEKLIRNPEPKPIRPDPLETALLCDGAVDLPPLHTQEQLVGGYFKDVHCQLYPLLYEEAFLSDFRWVLLFLPLK
jgi:hypothetical protein